MLNVDASINIHLTYLKWTLRQIATILLKNVNNLHFCLYYSYNLEQIATFA